MSASQSQYASSSRQAVQPGPAGAASMYSSAPSGTFASGTKVQVGESRVVIDRYLSEGGFAHVYLVKMPKPINGTDRAVLKRVAVPDKEALANMRTEVETMKKLKGHRQIVTYFDSHASQLKGGGYEVFLLMEYCSGGGLIDFMNTRLQNRLTEPEVLKIFSDTAQGVACMHYLKPPLLHRDLKVENILINDFGREGKQFKLCDFGSAAVPRPAATSAAEGRLIEEDVQKHTTMQYRSPEMIDVYRKQPIDEKSDIWALGVLLYKLCYYTTPFEEQGQMAILNASFRFPGYPQFSDRIKKLIATMLQEKPQNRPNIYQVVKEVSSMRGIDCPLKDIYSGRTASESRKNQELPPTPGQVKSPPLAGAYKAAKVEEVVQIPDITPMRRGRPKSSTLAAGGHSAKPSPSPGRPIEGDPFAALDSNGSTNVSVDELSSRFPSLDHFSLLHESGNTFNFEQGQSSNHQREASNVPKSRDISQRVTEALADEAFGQTIATGKDVPVKSQSVPSHVDMVNASTQTNNNSPSPITQQTNSSMVSAGTMTTELTSPPPRDSSLSQRPIFKFQHSDHRSSSTPRPQNSPRVGSNDSPNLSRPPLLEHRSKSQTGILDKPASARPSLESSRPQPGDLNELNRSRSTNPRPRPVSTHLETAAAYFKGRSSSHNNEPEDLVATDAAGKSEENNISNVEFLRAMEEEESAKRKEKRLSSSGSKHSKRSSLPSMSLPGKKNFLSSRFGDAFKRFEHNSSAPPDLDDTHDTGLTPISGSVATDGRSDDGAVVEETEEMSPEVRRELERRRLSQEERRVAEAAAAYKQGLGKPGRKDSSRATSIQHKVQALLDESTKEPATKTAEGYGQYTRSPAQMQSSPPAQLQSPPPQSSASPRTPQSIVPLRKTVSASDPIPPGSPAMNNGTAAMGPPGSRGPSNLQSVQSQQAQVQTPRPSGPPKPQPKPQALRTGGTGSNPPVAAKPANLTGTNVRNLSVRGGGGVPPGSAATITSPVGLGVTGAEPGPPPSRSAQGARGHTETDEDWEANFSKKYPSLSGLEMVETEIGVGDGQERRAIRDI